MSDEPMSVRVAESVVPQDKAERVAAIIFEAIQRDLGQLHAEVAGIRSTATGVQAELALLANKADLQRVQAEVSTIQQGVQQLRDEMRTLEQLVKGEVRRTGRQLMLVLGAIAVVLSAVLFAALRLLPLAPG